MAQLIELPHVGESVVEGTIGKWLKQPGDRVERYDPLVEVVTDKVTMEVPSPVSGELLRIIAQEGETVPMGAPIAEVDDGSAPATGAPPATSMAPAAAPATVPTPTPAAAPASPTPTSYLITDARPVGPTGGSAVEAQSQEDEQPKAEPVPPAAIPPTVIRAVDQDRETTVDRTPNRLSPAVRRLAAEHNLDVDRIAGTGMGGRVTRNDVLRFLEHPGRDYRHGGARNCAEHCRTCARTRSDHSVRRRGTRRAHSRAPHDRRRHGAFGDADPSRMEHGGGGHHRVWSACATASEISSVRAKAST